MIVLEHIATGIAIIGAAIIIWGVIKGLVALLLAEFSIFRKTEEIIVQKITLLVA